MFTFLREIPNGQTPNLRQNGHSKTTLMYHSSPGPLPGRDARRAAGRAGGVVRGVEWYIKLFLGVHFADNLAGGHRGKMEMAKSPREIPLGVIPQMANFWPLAEGPKCRELP